MSSEQTGPVESEEAFGPEEKAKKKAADERARLDAMNALGDVWKPMADRGPWLTLIPPKRTYLLSLEMEGKPQPVLPLGKVGMFAGAGGAGKSWAMTQLALAVATGADWLGFTVESPGRVLLVLGEEEAEEARRRFFFAADAMGLSPERLELAAQRIWVLPMAGRSVALTRELDPNEDHHGGLPMTDLALEIERRLSGGDEPWRLVVLDPLSRFAGADVETDNAAATRFVQVLERLTQTHGTPTVLVTHHTTKGARQGQVSGTTDASAATGARGSSALTDGVRWQANLNALPRFPDVPRLVELAFVKNNYGPPTDTVTLCAPREKHGALQGATPQEIREWNEAREAVAVEEAREKKAVHAKAQGKDGGRFSEGAAAKKTKNGFYSDPGDRDEDKAAVPEDLA